MRVRAANEGDRAALAALWDAARAEAAEPAWLPPRDFDHAWAALSPRLGGGAAALALEEEQPVGAGWVSPPDEGRARLEFLYVLPAARRRGAGRALLEACLQALAGAGAESLSLEAPSAAAEACRRLGFEPVAEVLAAPLPRLRSRLDDSPAGVSRAVVHVQTDDRLAVERALGQFVPRLASPRLESEARGWIRVGDEVLDGDRDAQGRLTEDLSDRLGAVAVVLAVEQGAVVRFRLYERGRMVDEYLSVPTFYGALPKVEELSLEANPTLVSRLTGAPFEEVRRVARTAASPAELPPAEELYAAIARMMGLEP